MKRLILSALLVLGLGSAAQAANTVSADELPTYERVDSITAFRGPHSWTALDEDTLILWANPFQPYLVELRYPSNDLRFARAIGVSQFGSQIHARFDSVQIRGFRYPIEEIYKLSRDEARRLTRG